MAKPDLNPKIAEQPPRSDSLTDYDEQHLVTYLRLLDAEQEGASRVEMARLILGIIGAPWRYPPRGAARPAWPITPIKASTLASNRCPIPLPERAINAADHR